MGLENSISEMIERQDSLSDKADAAEGRLDSYIQLAAPGLQPIMGMLPNQCGGDADGDGLPDGWILPANDGFTSWAHVGETTLGAATEIIPGSLEDEFYTSIPGAKEPGYRSFRLHFWRWSWDFTAGGQPDSIRALSYGGQPFMGMGGVWIKEETPNALDESSWNSKVARGTNGWAVLTTAPPFPRAGVSHVGDFTDFRIQLDTANLPVQGSLLIAGPQTINTRYDATEHGWFLWPGLNRVNDGGDYRHAFSAATNIWETKA